MKVEIHENGTFFALYLSRWLVITDSIESRSLANQIFIHSHNFCTSNAPLNCTFIVSFASFDFEIGAAFSAIRITTRLLLSWERNCLRLTNRLSILLPSKLSSNNNAGHILSASFLPRFLARPPLRLVQLSTAKQHFLRRAARLVWVEFGRWQKCLRREKFDEILSLCLYWDWKYTEEWLHSQNLSKLSFKAQHKFETSW